MAHLVTRLVLCFSVLIMLLAPGIQPALEAASAPAPASTIAQDGLASPLPPPPGTVIPHPILTDVRVRRAIAYCTNRHDLIDSVYPFLDAAQRQSLLMDTFIPKTHWAYTAPPTQYTYPYNPTLGQQLLDAAGWTLAPGAVYRTNPAGETLALTLTTTTAGFRQTWAAAMEQNLRGCGIQLIRNHVPASWWFGEYTGLAWREFELGAFAWVAQPDPGGRTLYACDMIPYPNNGWRGQNYMGWCNQRASTAITTATSSLIRAERIQSYAMVQEEFAKDMVSLPVFQRVEVAASHKNLTGYVPDAYEYDTWNARNWALPGVTTLVVGMTWEPETLFPLVSYDSATHSIAGLIYGRGLTRLNGDMQAQLYTSVPTLENGGAITRTVSVSAGDTIVNADGVIGPLTAGDQVVNAAGQVVTYTGGGIDMTRIVVTGSYLNNMRWSNGNPLIQADLRLWDAVNCDPNSGATWSFQNQCQLTAQRDYLNDTTVRYTLLPGYLSAEYSTFLPGAYPSQRILSDGRKLEDVPPAEWSTLPEIQRSPIGMGPYRITSWQPGERMTFSANPYFVSGAPRTPNVEIRFISDSSTAVDQLLNGSIHILGSWALGGGAEAQRVLDADRQGLVKAYVLGSAAWEHVDMNLEIVYFTRLYLPIGLR